MPKIRVLIVDDSVVVRRLVSDVLETNPSIEVAGVAANGRIALAKIHRVSPDVIILDVEMPDLGGLGTLREIRKTYPKLPVIMFSTTTERGAEVTMEALASGANDYVSKPANVGSVGASMEQVRQVLIPKIFSVCPHLAPVPPPSEVERRARPPKYARIDERTDVLAIACSTGGPNALTRVLSEFPADFPAPILIVQHMPAMFTRLLAEQIAKKAQISVSEAIDGELLRPGHAFIAPGDFHLQIARKGTGQILTRLNHDAHENSCRPSADVLFRSVAEVFGKHTLGVVLTGMGRDGCLGSQAIHDAGGQILVQDQASSVVWGMAGAVVQSHLADGIWPLTELGEQILQRIKVARPLWNSHSLSTA